MLLILLLTIATYYFDSNVLNGLTTCIYVVFGATTLPYAIFNTDEPISFIVEVAVFNAFIIAGCSVLLYYSELQWAFYGSLAFLIGDVIMILRGHRKSRTPYY